MRPEREPYLEPEPTDYSSREPGDPEASEYRRRRRPVPVRRHRLADAARWLIRSWRPLLRSALALAAVIALYSLLFHSAWFVLQSSEQIDLVGGQQANPASVLGVFSADLGRNVFFIPLAARRQQLQSLPWVRQATVLRLWPARLQVNLVERVPIAFARVGDTLKLVDADGVLLNPPRGGNFDFPVLLGLAGVTASTPNSPRWRDLRQPQMRQYAQLLADLNQDGAQHSQDISEADLGNPGDLRIRVILPGGGTVLLKLGDHNFAARYALFLSQIAAWRQKYPALVAVDLQFDGQAIVDPGIGDTAAPSRPASKPSTHPAGRR